VVRETFGLRDMPKIKFVEPVASGGAGASGAGGAADRNQVHRRRMPENHRQRELAMSQASDRIYVSPGEAWAIEPSRLLGGPEAYFFLFGPTIKETERIGDVAVVY